MERPQLKTSSQLSADWGLATTSRSTDAKCDAQADRTDFQMCLIRAVGGGDRTADKCLSQSDAAAADVVGLLMSADCETLASELTLAT